MTQVKSNLQRKMLQKLQSIQTKESKNLLQKGFTLIELLIVVAILAILGAIALPNYLNQADNARVNGAQTSVKAAANGCAAMLVAGTSTNIDEYNDTLGDNVSASAADCVDGITYTSVGFAANGGNLSTQAEAVVQGTGARLTQTAVN